MYKRQLHDGFLEHPLPRGEVDAAGQHGDERHDDIAHERGRDLAERAADDDADGHIEHVAAHGKGLELFKKLLHGDVYKRQVLRPALRKAAVRAFAGKKLDANAVAELLHGEEPVSYTHLDVYKRQS